MFSIIAAMTKERVIGNKGRLPWNIPEEMELFTKITTGNTVIMGRRTFDSIGVLENRNNIVVTKRKIRIEGAEVCNDIDSSLEIGEGYGREIFVIGGAEIFGETVPIADKMYISYIKKNYPGDAFFPEFSEKDWKVYQRKEYVEFEQTIYVRR